MVGRDTASDIAVLKINAARPLPFVRFGDSTRPGSATGWSRSAIRSASAAPSPPASSRRSTAISTPASTTATSRPTRRSISGNSRRPDVRSQRQCRSASTPRSISPTGGNVGIGFAIPAEQVAPGRRRAAPRRARPARLYRRQPAGRRRRRRRRARHRAQPRRADPLGHPGRPRRPRRHPAGRRRDHASPASRSRPTRRSPIWSSQQPIGSRVPLELIRDGQRRNRHRRGRRAADRGGAGPAQRRRATTAPTARRSAAASRPTSSRPSQRSTQQSLGLVRPDADPGDRPAAAASRDVNVRGVVVGSGRSEQRRRPEGHPAGRRHPVDQPGADADARGGGRRGRGGAPRPGATRCCCWSAAATRRPLMSESS